MEAEGKQTAKYRENIDCAAAAAGTILAGRSRKAASRRTLMNFGLLVHPASAASNLVQGSVRTNFCLKHCLEIRLCAHFDWNQRSSRVGVQSAPSCQTIVLFPLSFYF